MEKTKLSKETAAIMESVLYQNFLSPRYCSDLKYAGFEERPCFFWKVWNGDVKLSSYVFDPDNYYKDAEPFINALRPVTEILPAYTIKEIEKHLPDFCICRVNNMYEISIDDQYGIEAIRDVRLPDAMGLMLYQVLKRKKK